MKTSQWRRAVENRCVFSTRLKLQKFIASFQLQRSDVVCEQLFLLSYLTGYDAERNQLAIATLLY